MSTHLTPWLFLWQSSQHPLCSQTRTESEAGCGPASPSACSPPLWQLLTDKKTQPGRESNSCDLSTEKHRRGGLMVQLTAGDDPADLGAGNLEEDAEGRDPGIGVQHCVQRPHQETCRDKEVRESHWGLNDAKTSQSKARAAVIFLPAGPKSFSGDLSTVCSFPVWQCCPNS